MDVVYNGKRSKWPIWLVSSIFFFFFFKWKLWEKNWDALLATLHALFSPLSSEEMCWLQYQISVFILLTVKQTSWRLMKSYWRWTSLNIWILKLKPVCHKLRPPFMCDQCHRFTCIFSAACVLLYILSVWYIDPLYYLQICLCCCGHVCLISNQLLINEHMQALYG